MSKQNPYLNARREWDERYGGLISRARNWQLMAAGSLAVAVVAVVGIAFVGSQSKIQPFVVVIDQLGSPVAVARPAPVARADLDKRLMVAQLAAFIKDVRSIVSSAGDSAFGGVDDEIDLTILQHVDHMRTTFGDLIDQLNWDLRRFNGRRCALGGQQFKAQGHQLTRHFNGTGLVVVLDGQEHATGRR